MRNKLLSIFIILIFNSCSKELVQYQLQVEVNPTNGGTVTPASGIYDKGKALDLLAVPSSEYVFKEWRGDLTGSSNPAPLIINANKQITGYFEKRQYSLNLTIEGQGTVKEELIAVASNALYQSGSTVKLTASPAKGWQFSKWKGDIGGADTSIIVKIESPKNITAEFAEWPMVPAVNQELFPNINWNDHVGGKNTPYDFNKDGIPDIVSYESTIYKNTLPAILKILDYSGKTIFTFDLKSFKPNVRDSLSNVLIDYAELNGDGYLDLGLSYMSEWWKGTPGAPGSSADYIGNNVYLLLSKGNFQFDVVEVLDEPNKPVSFNINLFDWDADGLVDILYSDLFKGIYLKNLGANKFERRTLTAPFKQSISNKVDFDKDGAVDYINLYLNQIDENGNYTSNDNYQTLSVLSKNGVKHFPVLGKTLKKYIYVKNGIETAERITLIDGDSDGDLDLVVGSLKVSNSNIWTYTQDYFENKGTQFEYKKDYIEIDETLVGEFQAWTKDIDNDGDTDLFYPSYRKSQLNAPRGGYFWWENTGKGFKINKKFVLKY